MKPHHLLLTLLVVALWGLHFPIIKLGLGDIPPFPMLALRLIGCVLVFAPFVKWSWARMKAFIPFGLWFNVVHLGGIFLAIEAADAASIAVVMKFYVVLVALAAWMFRGEHVSRQSWVGMAIALLGIIVIYGVPSMTLLGFAFAIPAMLGAIMREFEMKKLGQVKPAELMLYGSMTALPFVTIISVIVDLDGWMTLPDSNLWIVGGVWGYQVFVMSATLILWQWLIHHNDVHKVVPFNLLNPVFAILGAMVILSQPLTLPLILGCALTLAGVGLHAIQRRKAKILKADKPV